MLVLAAFTAVLGSLVVERSHEHYRNARDGFRELERRLGILDQGLGLLTTPGMRGEKHPLAAQGGGGFELPKVYRAVQLLLVCLALFDVVAAVMIWPE
ncbi:hypothetical protein [Vulgatibacter sp.]|uniref:hypothetical protein n=1 Tax=Vulgatibacter sp. TaxID=1971226 RepID=UPI00356615E4